MFQSSDDLNIDEDFLSDAFEIPNTNSTVESNKRNSDSLNDQPEKKKCAKSPDTNTKNILSIINFKSSQSKSKTESNSISVPNVIIPSIYKSEINKNNVILNNSVNNKINRRVVQRKFPGPAGILPEQKQLNINIKILEECDTSVNNNFLQPDEIICSQLSEDVFKKGPWLKMITDWSTTTKISLPDKYTISWTKSKAAAKRLINQKTPFLAAVIETIDCSNKDPMILLKDKTDEILATFLHEVWDQYGDFLHPGSVVLLKQVGVLSTLKKHYLAITLNNLVCIYSHQVNHESDKMIVKTTYIQKITVEDFLKIIEKTKHNYKAQKALQKIHPPLNKALNNPLKYLPKHSLQKPSVTNASIPQGNNLSKNEYNVTSKSSVNNILSNHNLKSTTEEENVILTQILDGVNTESLFEDF